MMTQVLLPRRGFILGLAASLASPAICRAENLMHLSSSILILPHQPTLEDYHLRIMQPLIERMSEQFAQTIVRGAIREQIEFNHFIDSPQLEQAWKQLFPSTTLKIRLPT